MGIGGLESSIKNGEL